MCKVTITDYLCNQIIKPSSGAYALFNKRLKFKNLQIKDCYYRNGNIDRNFNWEKTPKYQYFELLSIQSTTTFKILLGIFLFLLIYRCNKKNKIGW